MNKINFTPFPNLSNERINLRRLNPSDENEIFAIRSDEKIAEFLDRPICTTINEARQFINMIDDGIENKGWYYWAVTFITEPKLIGTICLWNFSEDKLKAEIGFELLPEYQRQGIMDEAVTSVINYGFSNLKLHSILGEVDPNNFRSIKLMKKHGFKLIETSRETDLGDVEISKTVVYELINTEINK